MKDIKLNELPDILANNKYTVCEFYAPWCKDCKRIDLVMNTIEMKKPEDVVMVRINTDENETARNDYQIGAIPTFVGFVSSQEVGRIMEPKSIDTVLAFLKELVK